MIDFRKLAIVAALGSAMTAFAQAPAAEQSDWTARMDQQMTAMRSLHEQMANARTPEERNALMASQRALMQSGMQMMGGMGPGNGPHGMAGMGSGMGSGMGPGRGMAGAGPGAMHADASAPADWAARQQWMEKRMDVMQSMMQLMVDRLPPDAAKK